MPGNMVLPIIEGGGSLKRGVFTDGDHCSYNTVLVFDKEYLVFKEQCKNVHVTRRMAIIVLILNTM